jgi:hypothetical protein
MKKSINIPTKDDLNKVESSSNLEAANHVRYIPTKVNKSIQKIYNASIGSKKSGFEIRSNHPDSTLIIKNINQARLIAKKSLVNTINFSIFLFKPYPK